MDSLALLCNLYGDGPATLHRLREAGLGSLEALEGAETERLAGLLRTSVRAARRFQGEARLLRDRTDLAPERAGLVRPEPAAQRPTDPLLRKVLDAWRRMDDEETFAEGAHVDVQGSAQATPREIVAEPVERAVELRLGVLEGLSADWIETLAGQGVATLADLAGCDALEVSRVGRLAYTRLLRLQLLARRELGARGLAAEQAPNQGTAERENEDQDVLLPQPAGALPYAPVPPSPAAASEAPALPRFSPAERPVADLPSGMQEALLETLSLPAPSRGPDVRTLGEETLDTAGPFA